MEKIWIMGWWVERDSLDTSNILGNVPIFSTVWWIWSYDPLDQHSPLFHKNGSCSIVTKIHTLVAATLILYCMVWLSGVQRGSLIHCNVEKSCGIFDVTCVHWDFFGSFFVSLCGFRSLLTWENEQEARFYCELLSWVNRRVDGGAGDATAPTQYVKWSGVTLSI